MGWTKKSYQKLSTVLKNQPSGWLWDGVNQNFADTVKTEVEDYFYERYINSTNPETFKRYFTTYANMYYIPFMKMYDTFMTDFDPLISRIYHETYNNATLRDNTHNTTTNNTQTNNLTDKTTRTDNLKQTQSGTNTRTDDLSNSLTSNLERTDNLSQSLNSTTERTDNLTQSLDNTTERTDNLDQSTSHTGSDTTTNTGTTDSHVISSDTIEENNKNLHSDMPQSNVASTTIGFPNVTWTYASDMQDTHSQGTKTGNSTTTNTQNLSNEITYNNDIMVANTGTQTTTNNGTQKNTGTQTTTNNSTQKNTGTQTTSNTSTQKNTGTQTNENSQTTDNTGTQTTNAEHSGDVTNNGSSNLKINDDEKTNGERDIKEQSINTTEAYQNYWSYLRNSNAWVWLMSKLDDCFLGILSYEDEDEYEAGYVFIR